MGLLGQESERRPIGATMPHVQDLVFQDQEQATARTILETGVASELWS